MASSEARRWLLKNGGGFLRTPEQASPGIESETDAAETAGTVLEVVKLLTP